MNIEGNAASCLADIQRAVYCLVANGSLTRQCDGVSLMFLCAISEMKICTADQQRIDRTSNGSDRKEKIRQVADLISTGQVNFVEGNSRSTNSSKRCMQRQ